MRIGYLSSYPPLECGIATYTNYLRTAMSPQVADTFVVAPIGAEGADVIPVYQNGSGAFAPDVYNVLMQRTPDLVHIQHEYGLFGPSRGMEIIDLVFRLRLIRVPVVITLHTVYESLSEEEEFMLGHLLKECSAVIVHEEFQRHTLARHLGPEIAAKLHVIDHGVREVEPIPNAKTQLDLEGKKVVMMLGYFRPTKGFHKITEFLPQVCSADEDVVFVLAGKTRNIEYGAYRHELLDQLRTSRYADRIVMLQGQFAQHTFDTTLSAADVVVLPYDVGAQSGVLAHCLAFGRPIVTSRLRAFQNVTARSGAGVSCDEDPSGTCDIAPAGRSSPNAMRPCTRTYSRPGLMVVSTFTSRARPSPAPSHWPRPAPTSRPMRRRSLRPRRRFTNRSDWGDAPSETGEREPPDHARQGVGVEPRVSGARGLQPGRHTGAWRQWRRGRPDPSRCRRCAGRRRPRRGTGYAPRPQP